MAGITVDQIRSLGGFHPLYKFSFNIVTFPKTTPTSGAWPSTSDLNLRCTVASVPGSSHPPMTVAIRGHKIHQPGPVAYDTGGIKISFVETLDSKINLFIAGLREINWVPKTGVQYKKSEIEFICNLSRLNLDDTPFYQYVLYGCWLSDSTGGGGFGAENQFTTPELTIMYDHFTESAVA
jgi:hypothetical protein